MPAAFITVNDLSSALGLDVSGDIDAQSVVDAACDICRTVAEQPFTQALGGTTTLDGTGTDALLLPNLPVTAVGTVWVNGGTIDDYVLNDNGILFRGTAGGGYWPRGRQNVKVSYDYGYTTVNVPKDVKRVALEVARRLAVQGVAKQESVGDVSVSYAVNSTDLTNGEMMILRKYRQVR